MQVSSLFHKYATDSTQIFLAVCAMEALPVLAAARHMLQRLPVLTMQGNPVIQLLSLQSSCTTLCVKVLGLEWLFEAAQTLLLMQCMQGKLTSRSHPRQGGWCAPSSAGGLSRGSRCCPGCGLHLSTASP